MRATSEAPVAERGPAGGPGRRAAAPVAERPGLIPAVGLAGQARRGRQVGVARRLLAAEPRHAGVVAAVDRLRPVAPRLVHGVEADRQRIRSEEHTYELQSLMRNS